VIWKGDAGKITINDTDYQLQQCHWHSPSEHTFNGSRFVCLPSLLLKFKNYTLMRTLPPTPLNTLQSSHMYIYFYPYLSFLIFVKRHDLELHLVHYSSQGGIAVVAIVYKYGRPDRFLSKVLSCISTGLSVCTCLVSVNMVFVLKWMV